MEHRIITDLRDHIRDHPDFGEAFSHAFNRAIRTGIPEFAANHIGTLDDYIKWYNAMLTWVPTENLSGTHIYSQLCLFYFVLDCVPVKSFQNPISPDAPDHITWLSGWIIRYARQQGLWMDDPDSINAETFESFYAVQPPSVYHMSDYPIPTPNSDWQWDTFNKFFARKISLAVRPIASPTDPSVIVSPADSHFDGHWPVDKDGFVRFKGVPWPITELLRDSKYAKYFDGGIFTHSFLNTTDYHRQHAPVAGTVVEKKNIEGLCYLQVGLTYDNSGKLSLGMKRHLESQGTNSGEDLNAPDSPGYQFIQSRGLLVLDTAIGYVAVLPIGMCQVSSVVFTVNEGDKLDKGQEISYFQFGGSDIVTVFQREANVQFTPNIGDRTWFGSKIATATPFSNAS